MKKLLALTLFLLFVCAGAAAPAKRPKLILAVVIDQFRYDYLLRFRSGYKAGFARVLEQGAVFADAHHVHFPTVTAVGHSTFLSGATPSLSGIVANEWFDRETGKAVTSVSDPNAALLGGQAGQTGSSPRRLLVSTVGDEIKMQGRNAKVIGVSIKDRGAILPAGHMANAAYWYDDRASGWVSSSYYMDTLPAWVKKINQNRPSQRSVGAQWRPLDAKPDTAPFCTMAAGDDKVKLCGSLEATPWGNEMIEDFAEHALAEENLGSHDDGPDVLTVSFSSNDYVGHAFGPDSPQVRDICVRTDRLLGKLLDFVDRRVGPGNTLFVMTADHGVAPLPEVNQSRNMQGGRLSRAALFTTINDALTAKYGAGKWITATSGPIPYLNRELIAEKHLDPAEVEEAAAEALRTLPHVFRVYTREHLLKGQVLEDYVSRAVRNGFYRQRSGDIIVIPEAYFLYETAGTSHGTPFNYDNHVPVIFMGPGVKAGHYYEPIAVNDIAPTLATIVGVEAPSGSVGRILREILE